MANQVRIVVTAKDEVSSTFDKIQTKATTLSKTDIGKGLLQGAGIAGFGTIAGAADAAASAVIDFGVQSIKAASDLNETITKSDQIFGDNAQTVKAWAATASSAFGQSKRAALDTASGFAGLFKTVGISLTTATGYAENLTKLGSDLASFFNTDVATATAALKSGLAGESEPLRKFNVFLSESAVSAKLAEMGIKKVGGQFTEAEKATARYKLILEQTSDAQGDFARTADGLANSQRTLNAKVEDLQASLGDHLLPLVASGTVALVGLVDATDKAANSQASLGDRLQTVGTVIGGFEHGIFEGIKTLVALGSTTDVVSSSAADAARAWDTGSERIGTAAANAGGSLKDLGSTSTTSGGKVTHALDKIIWKAQDVEAALGKLGSDAADAYFDPLITKGELAANKRSQAEQRAIIASKHSTKAQVEDAKLRLLELQKDALQKEVALVGYGKMNAGEQKKFLADLKAKWKTATGDAKADIAALIAFIEHIPTSRTVNITVENHPVNDNGPGRAAGGPVAPYSSQMVGEMGPEPLVMGSVGGRVFPSMGGSSSGGGGVTIQLTVSTPLMTPGSGEALAAAIVPHVTKALRQQQLIGR